MLRVDVEVVWWHRVVGSDIIGLPSTVPHASDVGDGVVDGRCVACGHLAKKSKVSMEGIEPSILSVLSSRPNH